MAFCASMAPLTFITHYFMVLMDHGLFIHSSTKVHVACFQISGIRVKAAVNIPVQVFPRTYVFHSFGQILSTMTIESYSKSMAVFVRSRQTVI